MVLLVSTMNWLNIGRKDTTVIYMRQEGISVKTKQGRKPRPCLQYRGGKFEQLRLGDRLQVRWKVGDLPPRAVVPSLLLQPLLENASTTASSRCRKAGR